ncbi:MAG TPA: PAS domain-containing protein, partial [Pedobacter sp.]
RIEISPYRFAVAENEYRWIETIITDMTADPAVAGIVANSRDITQKIEHEIRIRESIERFDIVSRATSDAIYDLNVSTGIILWNKGIKGIFGYKETDQFTSDWWHDNIHPDDIEQASKDLQHGISEHRSRMTAKYRFRCADGSYKYVLDRFFMIYDDAAQSPVRMIGSLQDITENVRYIKDIEEQNCRLREISWMQSHVVRAPLARLMGLASLLKDEQGISKELIAHFSESANELDQIIRTIVRKTENF